MNVRELLRLYDNGVLTADHLVIQVVRRINDSTVDSFLLSLPEEILALVRDYAIRYEQNRAVKTISIGGAPDPEPERMACILRWLNSRS